MVDHPPSTVTMSVDDVSRTESMRSGLIKFDGKFANQVQNPLEVPKFLQTLYCNLQRVDVTFQLGDKDGNPMDMSAIPATYQGCVDKFNLRVVPKRNHQHLMFVTTFLSTKPFGVLKTASIDWLRRHNLFMNRHALDAGMLDIAIAGLILRAHPRYHSPDVQRTRMENKMNDWWKSLSLSDRMHWPQLQSDENGDLQVPPFFVNARSVRGHDNTRASITETAFLIMGPTDRIKLLMDVMEEVFQPDVDEDKTTTIYFVPSRLQKVNPKVYYQLIVQQKRYLQESQNVSIAGMHQEFMTTGIAISDPGGNAIHTTLEKAFTLHPAITRIDPGSYAIPLGKWNITTTKTGAAEAKAWIDQVISSMPEVQRRNTGFPNFPEVIRMQAVTPTTTTTRYDGWAQEVTTTNQQLPIDNRKQPPSYSTNPQEAHVPPLLRFDYDTSPPGSYAQAAGTFSKNTSTFISTMSPDKAGGVETVIQDMRRENAQMRKEMGQKIDAITTQLTDATDNNSTNNRNTATTSTMDSLLQEILKKLDHSQRTMEEHRITAAQHQASAQTRFDTLAAHQSEVGTRFDTLEDQQSAFGTRFDSLEDQQSGFGTTIKEVHTTIDSIRGDQVSLRQVNEALLHRINRLEENGTSRMTGSPVRKRRPRKDESPHSPPNSLRKEPPPKMIPDASPNHNTQQDTPASGWDMPDDLSEFSDDEHMEDTPTKLGTSKPAGGSKPANNN